MMKLPDKPKACELCRREMEALTKHHAIPRTMHSNKRVRKRFTKEQCITQVLWLCRPCHSHIHRTLSEKQMADDFHSIESLLSLEKISEFVEWIKSKPEGFKPKF